MVNVVVIVAYIFGPPCISGGDWWNDRERAVECCVTAASKECVCESTVAPRPSTCMEPWWIVAIVAIVVGCVLAVAGMLFKYQWGRLQQQQQQQQLRT